MKVSDFTFVSRRFFFWILFILPLQGCATQTGFSTSFPERLTESQNEWRFRHGKDFRLNLASVPQTGPVTSSHTVQLQTLLDQLVAVSPLEGYAVRVAVVNDPKLNAFTDGQSIFVTTGLLMTFQRDQNVIASVLAHELGHILGHHVPDEKSRIIALEYLSYLTPALSALPYGGFYGSAAGTAVRQGAKVRRFSYSRVQENEADAISVFLASKAGYHALGLSEFLEVVTSSGFGSPNAISIPTSLSAIPESALVVLLSSSPLYRVHPPSKERQQVVGLMKQRVKGEIDDAGLRKKFRWLAALYTTLESRSPQKRHTI